MSDFRESPEYKRRAAAAAMGCGICGGGIQDPIDGGDPFSSGPYCGRYWCKDCFTLYYDEHPEHVADVASRQYIANEAREIRKNRGWELLFEEGENRAYLTERGTLIINLTPVEGFGLGEYHPEQFQVLLRALHEINKKDIYGFTLNPTPEETPKT